MSPRAVIWRFLAFKPPMSTIKLPAIRLVDMWTAMRRFAIYCYSLFTNVIPKLLHLAVRLQIGQRVYFTASNVAQRAEAPPATILTSFFAAWQSDPFYRTPLYSEMPRYYTWNASTKTFQRRKHGDSVPGHPHVRSTDSLCRRMLNASICDCSWWVFEGQHHSNHLELLMA